MDDPQSSSAVARMRVRGPHGSPLLVHADQSVETLHRIPFAQHQEDPRYYDEAWLQERLYANPEVLPITEVDRKFAPAFSLGREVPTNAGPIDLLLISPGGYLTLVETKLWRNPEARREVVGQIIDYAKEFTKWTLSDLQEALRRSRARAASDDLYAHVQPHGADISQQEFHDTLANNLRRARVLLLLVGDGIRENVQDISDYLEKYAQLQFALGLVNLAVYQRADGSRLLVPNLVSRTREVTRAVIHIENASNAVVTKVEATPEEPASAGRERYTLSETDFMSQLEREAGPSARDVVLEILDFMGKTGLQPEYHQSSFTARLPNPSGGTAFSLFNVDTNGTIVFGYLRLQLERYGLPMSIQETYANDIVRAFGRNRDKWGYPLPLSFKDYRDKRADFQRAVEEVVRVLQTTEPTQS